jgi:competence protein ComEC
MTAPAFLVAIPLLIGVLVGAALDLPPIVASIGIAVAWIAAAAALYRRMAMPFVVAAGTAFLIAGAAIGGEAHRTAAHPAIREWNAQQPPDATVHLTGVLRTDANPTPSGVTIVLDVHRAAGHPVAGGVRLSVLGLGAAAAVPRWRAGRTVTVDASLREPVDYGDPGVASDRERLGRQGIALIGSVKSAALVTVDADGSLVSEAAAALRRRVRLATASAVGRWSPSSAAVVSAILIGDRSGLNPEDERRLQEAGTYHVIAISGGNIALLTALLLLGGRIARVPARAAAAAAIGLLGF